MTPGTKRLSAPKRILERLVYLLDNFFTRGFTAQLTVLFVLMFGLILSGTIGIRLGLFDPRNKDVAGIGHKIDEGFWDALWWSTMHIFDASFVSQDYGATGAVVALGLGISLLGLILFGGIIGLVSAGVERKLDELTAGNRIVVESGHILILGWNNKIFSILDLFEDYHRHVKVVILANHPIAEMSAMLRLGRGLIKRVKPVVRTGSPTQLVELERMAFRSAQSIIVLADESHANQSEEPDLCTIKTLMLLAAGQLVGHSRPKMVAEIIRRENLDIARIASQRLVSLICSSEILSRIIVQASRQPGLTHIYDELFGFAGTEIFIKPHPECSGRRFGELIFEFPGAVLMGTSTKEQREGRPYFRQLLNPGNDHVVAEGEWLILLADNSRVVHQAKPQASEGTEFKVLATREKVRDRVLLLGWNSNIFNILREYGRFLDAGSEITIVSHHTPEGARGLIDESLEGAVGSSAVNCVNLDYTMPARLDALLANDYGTCIILADESSEESDPDARTIVTILLIKDYESRHPQFRFKHIVAEVLSTSNAELIQLHNKVETVISPRLVSMLVAQLSQQLMLERVYHEMMNANANEIYLREVGRYTRRPSTCTFSDLMRGASKLGELAIGVKVRADADNPAKKFGVRLNPPKEAALMLSENDEVIVISVSGRTAA